MYVGKEGMYLRSHLKYTFYLYRALPLTFQSSRYIPHIEGDGMKEIGKAVARENVNNDINKEKFVS